MIEGWVPNKPTLKISGCSHTLPHTSRGGGEDCPTGRGTVVVGQLTDMPQLDISGRNILTQGLARHRRGRHLDDSRFRLETRTSYSCTQPGRSSVNIYHQKSNPRPNFNKNNPIAWKQGKHNKPRPPHDVNRELALTAAKCASLLSLLRLCCSKIMSTA